MQLRLFALRFRESHGLQDNDGELLRKVARQKLNGTHVVEIKK